MGCHRMMAILMMMIVFLCSFECSDFNIEPVLPEMPDKIETPAIPPVITINSGHENLAVYESSVGKPSVVSFTIDSLAENGVFSFTSDDNLSVEVTEVSDGEYLLYAEAKEEFQGRQKVVLTASNGNLKREKTLHFIMAALSLEKNEVLASCEAATYAVKVNATVQVYADCESDWVSVVAEESRILISLSENGTGTLREATVTVTDEHGVLCEKVVVTQRRETVTLERERAALIAIYEALGGENWNDSENWCTDADLNDWAGVSVGNYSGERHVQYLHIQCQNAVGQLPDEIGDLEYLTELIITKEPGITGTIPDSFKNFKRIKEISITSTSISGDLPDCLGELRSLGYLNLKGNYFTGAFPQWLLDMPELYNFGFQQNCLSGEIPVEFTKTTWWNTEATNTGEKLGEGQLRIGQKEGYRLWVEGCEDFPYGYDDGSMAKGE